MREQQHCHFMSLIECKSAKYLLLEYTSDVKLTQDKEEQTEDKRVTESEELDYYRSAMYLLLDCKGTVY